MRKAEIVRYGRFVTLSARRQASPGVPPAPFARPPRGIPSRSRNLKNWQHELGGGLPRSFWILWAGMLVNRAGSFVVPFLAIYLTQGRGFSIATAGMVASAYGLGAAVASPVGGYFADHVGRRATLVGALGLGGLGMISLGFAHRIEHILPGCFLVAVLGESYRPAMQAAVADLVPAADRVRAFGLIYWVINLGFSIGLALGGLLASFSFQLLFIGDGLTSLLFAFIVWRAVPETRTASQAHASRSHGIVSGFLAPYRDRAFLYFLLLSLLVLLVFMQHVTALPIDIAAHGISNRVLGMLLAINGVLIVFVQPFLAPLVAQRNRSRVLALGTVVVGVGFGLNALAQGAPLFALSVVVWSLGEIGVLPIANAVVADIAPPELRGRYQGAYGLCFGLAAFGAPLIGSIVMQEAGAPALWTGCAVAGLLTGTGHLLLAPRLARLREVRQTALRV